MTQRHGDAESEIIGIIATAIVPVDRPSNAEPGSSASRLELIKLFWVNCKIRKTRTLYD
jgi:hypothetical protein